MRFLLGIVYYYLHKLKAALIWNIHPTHPKKVAPVNYNCKFECCDCISCYSHCQIIYSFQRFNSLKLIEQILNPSQAEFHKKAHYASLKAHYASLNADHASLKAHYASLKTHYASLKAHYASLKAHYASLSLKWRECCYIDLVIKWKGSSGSKLDKALDLYIQWRSTFLYCWL